MQSITFARAYGIRIQDRRVHSMKLKPSRTPPIPTPWQLPPAPPPPRPPPPTSPPPKRNHHRARAVRAPLYVSSVARYVHYRNSLRHRRPRRAARRLGHGVVRPWSEVASDERRSIMTAIWGVAAYPFMEEGALKGRILISSGPMPTWSTNARTRQLRDDREMRI